MICNFIRMELNKFVRKCHSFSNKSDIAVTNFSQIILPTTWRQKPAGIDVERNYVTLSPCVLQKV